VKVVVVVVGIMVALLIVVGVVIVDVGIVVIVDVFGVMWVEKVVVVRAEDVVVTVIGILVVGIGVMELKLNLNLFRSAKSFDLCEVKETGLFSWLKVKSGKQDGVVFIRGTRLFVAVVVTTVVRF
jgi:hypothetical protein